MRILFATSELYPLIKTGGLADASAGLSEALASLGEDLIVALPAYRDVLEQCPQRELVAQLTVAGCTGPRQVQIERANFAAGPQLLLIAIDNLFDRPGNPYQGPDGSDWWDNGERFALFARVVSEIALDRAGLNWRADAVHCHDWQTGLVPLWLSLSEQRPQTVFTVHNLSYPGQFPRSLFDQLGLPGHLWHFEKAEFYGYLSMLKCGIVFADQVTTVSPSYAEEICHSEQGYGLHGLLAQKRDQGRLHGILNGIDQQVWNPASDPYLSAHYSAADNLAEGKRANKQALLERLGASFDLAQPLCGFVGRLVEQKGIDLILATIEPLLASTSACFALVGSGMNYFEAAFADLAQRFPERIAVFIGYDEGLAHLLEAGSDIFLMPSRFEPCGLNQMYSLAYGTLPIVHAVGGLKDTVVDSNEQTLANARASGFVFKPAEADVFAATLQRALQLYQQPQQWQAVQQNAMALDHSWDQSAANYLQLYQH